MEHLFSDTLLRMLMPGWLPFQRAISMACGTWIAVCGLLVLAGWHVRTAAAGLAVFLVCASFAVHVPALFAAAPSEVGMCPELWVILQRSNLAKNVCLFGVCLQLLDYKPGRYSFDAWFGARFSHDRKHAAPRNSST
jgi:uncharacterized membrane protein YphA (DoxX/SURF4 family)